MGTTWRKVNQELGRQVQDEQDGPRLGRSFAFVWIDLKINTKSQSWSHDVSLVPS